MNDHIIEYLKYYIGLKDAPNYAVLIDGEWGSGKTFLVNKFIENEKDHKFIRVSLYGVCSIADIENTFFIALHPVLGSKTARVASQLLKGILKTAIKVDLNKNGNDDITIDYKIPDSAKWLADLDKHIIVIDDLERSTLPINIVLGYLNDLIESSGQKVIIIANEKEIGKTVTKEKKETQEGSNKEEKANEENNYCLIKEKLVGRSFTVNSDFENAFINFTFGLSDDAKRMLRNNQLYISKIFADSSYNNLRILKQTIIDFDRFYTFLPQIPVDKKELIEHIILLFFSTSFEVRKGAMPVEAISNTLFNRFDTQNILLKYQDYTQIFTHPIAGETLEKYFVYGSIDLDPLKKEIFDSFYFHNENTPAWKKLQDYYLLSDEEFSLLSKVAIERLKSKKITDKFELFEVVCLFINLSYLGLVKYKPGFILSLGKINLKNLIQSGVLKSESGRESFGSEFELSAYNHKKYKEIDDFITFIHKNLEDNLKSELKKKSIELLASITTSLKTFENELGSVDNHFYIVKTQPILKYINVDAFDKKINALHNKEKRILAAILNHRYRLKEFRNKLMEEQKWLESLKSIFQKRTIKGKVSGLIMKDLVGIIEKILEDFKKDEIEGKMFVSGTQIE